MKGLSAGTDIEALARQIVSRCDLIQPSRLPEVEQVLLYMQSRKGTLRKFDGTYMCMCVCVCVLEP